MKYADSLKKVMCAMVIALTLAPSPLYGNANIDQALGYGAASWIMNKVFGNNEEKKQDNGTCMVFADELNSIPLRALMTARHMTMYAANTEPRSREFVQRLSGAMGVQDMYFMDLAKGMGKYWALMEHQSKELDKMFDDTALSDRGLARPFYLNKVILIVEKPGPKEIRLTYTFPADMKKKDCCVRNTRSVYLSVSTEDYGTFDPVPK